MEKYQYIQASFDNHITVITINRPEVRNALHPAAHQELDDAFSQFEASAEQRVAIITGAGEQAFCAGRDLKATAMGQYGATEVAGGFGGLTNREDRLKPVIAAVNGYAMGGGFEIALACDLIVASDNARFGLPEPRVGLVAGAGGMHRLIRCIPQKIALGMLLTGNAIDAEAAFRWGLVNQVVPMADLLSTARQYAFQILECAPISVALSRQAAMQCLHLPVKTAMSTKTALTDVFNNNPDRIEGPKAFAEKRPPNWKGQLPANELS